MNKLEVLKQAAIQLDVHSGDLRYVTNSIITASGKAVSLVLIEYGDMWYVVEPGPMFLTPLDVDLYGKILTEPLGACISSTCNDNYMVDMRLSVNEDSCTFMGDNYTLDNVSYLEDEVLDISERMPLCIGLYTDGLSMYYISKDPQGLRVSILGNLYYQVIPVTESQLANLKISPARVVGNTSVSLELTYCYDGGAAANIITITLKNKGGLVMTTESRSPGVLDVYTEDDLMKTGYDSTTPEGVVVSAPRGNLSILMN